MPMMNFEQLYPALHANLKTSQGMAISDEDIFFGLYDGYDGVYPFMTANVTTPYTIGFSDLSQTGPIVVDLPPGAIYGVVDNAWMQPIHEIEGKPGNYCWSGRDKNIPRISTARSFNPIRSGVLLLPCSGGLATKPRPQDLREGL